MRELKILGIEVDQKKLTEEILIILRSKDRPTNVTLIPIKGVDCISHPRLIPSRWGTGFLIHWQL